MTKFSLLLILILGPIIASGQSLEARLAIKHEKQLLLHKQLDELDEQIELLKFEQIQEDLRRVGLPAGEQTWHSAMVLSYAEEYEQARWVAHIIRPEVADSRGVRTNDFREDPLVTTGSAVEADYFLKDLQADSTYKYGGFGWDHDHLAPSADFRWSEKELSESFLYSNMSPQLGDFNRDGWAELEGLLSGYVAKTGRQLHVVTGGVLKDGLSVIDRGVNKVSIPEQYYKVVLDLDAGKAIAFLMPSVKLPYPIEHYAVPVDDVEELTGLDFFNLVEGQEAIEQEADNEFWIPAVAAGDVDPIYAPSLPRGHFNTVQAKLYMGKGKKVTVVGGFYVVSEYAGQGELMNLNVSQYLALLVNTVFAFNLLTYYNTFKKKADQLASIDQKIEATKKSIEIDSILIDFAEYNCILCDAYPTANSIYTTHSPRLNAAWEMRVNND